MEDETHFHILNKMIKKIILIKKIWYGGNRTNRTQCGAPEFRCVINLNFESIWISSLPKLQQEIFVKNSCGARREPIVMQSNIL